MLDGLNDGISTTHELGKRKRNHTCNSKGYGETSIGQVVFDLVVAALGKEHATVVKRPKDATGKAKKHDKSVVDVRKVCGKGEAEHRAHAEHLRDEKVRDNRGRHDRDNEGGIELLVYLLNRKENSRKRCVEGGRHACCCATGDKQALLSPSALERLCHSLSGHAAKLDRGALSSKREARKGAERPL